MLRVRSSPIIVSPTVMMPAVVSVLLSRPIFFFSYFCRCVSALAVNIVVTLGEVGLKEGHGGGLVIVTSKPMLAHLNLNAMPISPPSYVLRWRFSKGAPKTPLSCAVQKTSNGG